MVIFLQKTFFFCVKCLAVMLKLFIFAPVLSNDSAEIAQLVEHNLAKVGVASSSLVFRSNGCSNGGIGRHEGLKIPWPLRLCGFKSRFVDTRDLKSLGHCGCAGSSPASSTICIV